MLKCVSSFVVPQSSRAATWADLPLHFRKPTCHVNWKQTCAPNKYWGLGIKDIQCCSFWQQGKMYCICQRGLVGWWMDERIAIPNSVSAYSAHSLYNFQFLTQCRSPCLRRFARSKPQGKIKFYSLRKEIF